MLEAAWLEGVTIKLGERVATLTSFDRLAPRQKLVIVRVASSHVREIARDSAAGPSLALLGWVTKGGRGNLFLFFRKLAHTDEV